MTDDATPQTSEQSQNLLAPIIKANKLSAANLETLVNFQMSALQSYVDTAIGRMKAAAEISDPTSLQAFMAGQVEAMASLQRKFMDDARILSELTARFKAEFDQLARDSLSLIK
ncbi:MAG: phasin family protein [Candidatus Contendobacter sp.]|nr:phasin family protein [Candidatus Contendobacter sp.]MDG4558078.1 phasin family protein [Candidatus Contendobacter sp.]